MIGSFDVIVGLFTLDIVIVSGITAIDGYFVVDRKGNGEMDLFILLLH